MKGTEPSIGTATSAFVGSALLHVVGGWHVLFALLYLLLRRVVRLIAGSTNDLDRDIELASSVTS